MEKFQINIIIPDSSSLSVSSLSTSPGGVGSGGSARSSEGAAATAAVTPMTVEKKASVGIQ